MLLSVCILTKNEELSIKNCLESIKEVADEIIILDSFSTDNTLSIAKNYTSNIYSHKWVDDFSFSRNLCISKSKSKWILIIDCDEVFYYNKNFLSSIKKTNYDAFIIIRKENYRLKNDNKKVSFPVGIIRLFKNKENTKFRNSVHERLDDCFIKNSKLVGIQNNCFLNHNINIANYFIQSKQKYYLKLINKEITSDYKNYWQIFQRAKTNFYFKNNIQAKSDLIFLINSDKVDTKIKVASIGLLSLIYSYDGESVFSIKILLEGLKKNKNTLLFCLLGDEYFAEGKYLLALKYYNKMKTNTNNISFTNCMYLITYVEEKDKIYKICSSLYSAGFLKLAKVILLFNKKKLGADSYYLLSLIYFYQNKFKFSKYYVRLSVNIDKYWNINNEFYKKILNY